jgi:hypothetical protein
MTREGQKKQYENVVKNVKKIGSYRKAKYGTYDEGDKLSNMV